jgi:endonuclease/exonuclease/phosphatase family metal-dependent hydrolase
VTAAPETALRVASYNIRKAVGTDRRRDPHRILGIIADLQADIVILQEADRRFGARPSALPIPEIQPQTGLVPLPVATEGPSLGWHGNSILLRPSVRVTGLCRFDLPGVEPRGAVIADLVAGDAPLRVIAVHLGLLRASRRRQLSALIEKLGTLDATPTLLAGDLNEWSLQVGLGRMAHHFTIHAPGKSFHANVRLAALDRIALDRKLEPRAAGVVDTPVTRRASDHLPIWMDIGIIA